MAFSSSSADAAAVRGSNPWVQRAQEPLVPTVQLSAVKKSVLRDLREIQKSSDEIAKLRKQRGSRDVGPRLLQLSTESRERARETSMTLRKAFAATPDGSPEHAALTTLSEDFKATLRRFQLEAEAAAPPPPSSTAGSSAGRGFSCSSHTIAISEDGAAGSDGHPDNQNGVAELQAVALNQDVIAERERGIANIHRTVHEVAEIFQDLALLVQEQGEHIDNIQTNIESAAQQTNKGVRELAKANRSQKRARSRLCCIAVALVVLLIALILVLKFALNMKLR